MDISNAMKRRYATKRMTGEKLSDEQINTILEVIRLAPTAYGLQAFNVIVSDKQEFLDAVYEAACPQVVVKQCSHLLILKNPHRLNENDTEAYLEKLRDIRHEDDEYIAHNRLKLQTIINNPTHNRRNWLEKQVYILLGYVTFAAAMMGVDATPIEGFKPAELDKLLQLDTEKEGTTLMIALGYRDEKEDTIAKKPKIRKDSDEIIEWR